jgi:pyridoxal phosphate enzyme (YggS family)
VVDGDSRHALLAARLAALRERIGAACLAASRDPSEIHLIVVTKTYPAADVLRLASLGVTDIGENRDQEAAAKAAEVAATGVTVRWHFIGHLQRNKVRSVVRYASMVHSVDSVRLAQALDHAVLSHSPPQSIEGHSVTPGSSLDALVQVSLDGDPTRGGAVVDGAEPDVDLERVLAAVAGAEGLRLRGLMTVAPLEMDPDRAFGEFAALASTIRQHYPEATVLSAGMSGDLEQAIRHGATHVRVGSAVLGERPPLE